MDSIYRLSREKRTASKYNRFYMWKNSDACENAVLNFSKHQGFQSEDADLPFVKAEDYQFFGKLLDERDEDVADKSAAKDRLIMKLLLKVKSGTPPMVRALRWIQND